MVSPVHRLTLRYGATASKSPMRQQQCLSSAVVSLAPQVGGWEELLRPQPGLFFILSHAEGLLPHHGAHWRIGQRQHQACNQRGLALLSGKPNHGITNPGPVDLTQDVFLPGPALELPSGRCTRADRQAIEEGYHFVSHGHRWTFGRPSVVHIPYQRASTV